MKHKSTSLGQIQRDWKIESLVKSSSKPESGFRETLELQNGFLWDGKMLFNSRAIKTVCQMSWNEAYNFVIWRVRQTWTGSPTTNMLNHRLEGSVPVMRLLFSVLGPYQHYASLLLDWTKTSQIWLLSSCGLMMIIDQIYLNGQAGSLSAMDDHSGRVDFYNFFVFIN